MKLKSFCTTEEMFSKTEEATHRMEENLLPDVCLTWV
jgi:hypothetical protein